MNLSRCSVSVFIKIHFFLKLSVTYEKDTAKTYEAQQCLLSINRFLLVPFDYAHGFIHCFTYHQINESWIFRTRTNKQKQNETRTAAPHACTLSEIAVRDIGKFAKFVRQHKRHDNAIFYPYANEHALGYRHRNRQQGRL